MSELLDVGCALPPGTVFAVANSDVNFQGDAAVLEAIFRASQGGCTFANRHEWPVSGSEPGLPYLYGYDLVVVENTFVSPVELASFCIGAPWWDYLFLYLLAVRGVPLTVIGSPVITHQTHNQQWSFESWRRGLALTANRIRVLTEEEGPAAALLGYMCLNFEDGVVPGFAIDRITSEFGTVLGTAIVNYVAETCQQIMWFKMEEGMGSLVPSGQGSLARYDNNHGLTTLFN